MLVLKEMRWSHAFSYGANNKIRFDSSDLLQLVGKNGHGKSSIPLILEEVVYNKNSKGIKKANILNRYGKSKTYTIELDFNKDSDEYTISTTRGSTQTVKLQKNGEDISCHTSTATYKLIEEVWGFDHKSFTQIVYQSNAFSLEFLTSTDTTRKKFLIDLLNLTKYTRALEHYKDIAKELNKDLEVITSKQKLYNAVISKYSGMDLSPKELLVVPIINSSLQDELAALNLSIANINTTNAKIAQNNKYKEILDTLSGDIELPPKPEDTMSLRVAVANSEARAKALQAASAGTFSSVCAVCKQPVDNSHKIVMVEEATAALLLVKPELVKLKKELLELEAAGALYNKKKIAVSDWEKYYGLIDKTLPDKPIDKAELLEDQEDLTKAIKEEQRTYSDIVSRNNSISSHNARVEVIKVELNTAIEENLVLSMQLSDVTSRLASIQVLVKTFGTSGLVAYKIECMVKDLEESTNKYLQDMSDGRFQIAFKMSSSDKLDVVITDNGTDIDIMALSNGELARVNISTLLAIRTLMQSLSSSQINLLILDETIESLDVDGKDRLVEVLLREDKLNTVLVSHGFTHPLLDKLNIVKENNISRIE